ncbi:MAG: ABC transporter permease [Verrucomicrobiota bacterium]
MNFSIGLLEGLRGLWSYKFRSCLTLLGMILGVASLFAMLAITNGMTFEMLEGYREMGTLERVTVVKADPPAHQEHLADQNIGLVYEDAVALKQNPFFTWVCPLIEMGVNARYQDRRSNAILYGCTYDFLVMDRHVVAQGRFFSDLDMINQHRVAVVGYRIAKELWNQPERDSVGSTILINGTSFKIIGLFEEYLTEQAKRERETGFSKKIEEKRQQRMKRRKKRPWQDPFYKKNNAIAIPLTTAIGTFRSTTMVNKKGSNTSSKEDLGPDPTLSSLQVGIPSFNQINEAKDIIRQTLLFTHNGVENFELETKEDEVAEIEKQIFSTRVNGLFIAGIGLLVGGLGITNIMLATMVDRIREIGIRRAIGAQPGDVFIQFILESTMLSLLGGVAGVFTGWGLLQLIMVLAPLSATPMIEMSAIIISFTSSAIVGLAAGIYPAVKASSLNVLEALNFE